MLRWLCAQLTLADDQAVLSSLLDAATACLLTRAETGTEGAPYRYTAEASPIAPPHRYAAEPSSGGGGRRYASPNGTACGETDGFASSTVRSGGVMACGVLALEPAVLEAITHLLSAPTLSSSVLRRALSLARRLRVTRQPAGFAAVLEALALLLQRQGAGGAGGEGPVSPASSPFVTVSSLRAAVAPLLAARAPPVVLRRSLSASDVGTVGGGGGEVGGAAGEEEGEGEESEESEEDGWDDWDESDGEDEAVAALMQEGGLFLRTLVLEPSPDSTSPSSYWVRAARFHGPRTSCPGSPLGHRHTGAHDAGRTSPSRPAIRRALSSTTMLAGVASPTAPGSPDAFAGGARSALSPGARNAGRGVNGPEAKNTGQGADGPEAKNSADPQAGGIPARGGAGADSPPLVAAGGGGDEATPRATTPWLELLFAVIPTLPHASAELLITAIRAPPPA